MGRPSATSAVYLKCAAPSAAKRGCSTLARYAARVTFARQKSTTIKTKKSFLFKPLPRNVLRADTPF